MSDQIIATIEGEPITWDGTKVRFRAKAAIDADGAGSSHGDPDFQPDTALHQGGEPLNADIDKYIVVPPAILRGVKPIVLGCQANVTDIATGNTTDAVVGDVGPRRQIGEISIACAKALGIPASPTKGGVDEHRFLYVIVPGVAAVVDGKQYTLQAS